MNQTYEWFNANKFSLNPDKIKYFLFHKSIKTNNLPLLLPKLLINDNEVEEMASKNGILIDKHLPWKKYIGYTENKAAKSIGLLYRAKPLLSKRSLLNTVLFKYSHLLKLNKFIKG